MRSVPTSTRDKILAELRAAPGSTVDQLNSKINMRRETLQLNLRKLISQGLVRAEGKLGPKPYTYYLTRNE